MEGRKIRPEALYIRDETDTKHIIVIKSRLLNWCNENAVQFKELINDIASIKDGKGNSAVLGKNRQMRIGTSFFLPCCRCIALKNEIVNKAIVAGLEVDSRIVIENEVRGVRTWRLS